eukprot:gene14823-biopygen12195
MSFPRRSRDDGRAAALRPRRRRGGGGRARRRGDRRAVRLRRRRRQPRLRHRRGPSTCIVLDEDPDLRLPVLRDAAPAGWHVTVAEWEQDAGEVLWI